MKKYRNVREKGGFTLVELVVVIAIIAILAAIAIPMVAGLINNATKTSDKVAANEIDKACMEYKTGIIWGIINQTEKNNSTQSDLPEVNASIAARVAAVKTAKVENALEFAAITQYEERIDAGNFVFDDTGKIFSADEHPEFTDFLKSDTTLGVLYYNMPKT